MPGTTHRIRRQRWVVKTGSAQDAFIWRKLLHDQGQDLLLPLLEKAFNEAAGNERVIHLPRLELKVALDSKEQLPDVLSDLIPQQIRKQLQSAGREQIETSGQDSIQTASVQELVQSVRQEPMQSAGQPALWKESTVQRNQFDVLLHYLATGSMPWEAASASVYEKAHAITETCREEWPQLLDHLRNKPESIPFYFRLLQLAPEEKHGPLLKALSESMPQDASMSQEMRTTVLRCITLLLDSGCTVLSRYTRLHIVASLLSQSLNWRQEGFIVPDLFSSALYSVQPKEMQAFYDLLASLPEPVAALLQHQKTPESESGSGFQLLKSNQDAESDNAPVILNPQIHETQKAVPVRSLDITAEMARDVNFHNQSVKESSIPDSPAEGLFPLLVHQAGLVILHPFIIPLFENTKIIEKGKAKLSSFALGRAAALLYFLATGNQELTGDQKLYEYELAFIKIWLGLHPETPLPVCGGLLQPGDQEEAESLLESVIKHWSILKNISTNGLRSSFLQRQALLREDEYGWKLHVERKPFDILLDQLPWSISIIKLPWMKKALYTEW